MVAEYGEVMTRYISDNLETSAYHVITHRAFYFLLIILEKKLLTELSVASCQEKWPVLGLLEHEPDAVLQQNGVWLHIYNDVKQHS